MSSVHAIRADASGRANFIHRLGIASICVCQCGFERIQAGSCIAQPLRRNRTLMPGPGKNRRILGFWNRLGELIPQRVDPAHIGLIAMQEPDEVSNCGRRCRRSHARGDNPRRLGFVGVLIILCHARFAGTEGHGLSQRNGQQKGNKQLEFRHVLNTRQLARLASEIRFLAGSVGWKKSYQTGMQRAVTFVIAGAGWIQWQ